MKKIVINVEYGAFHVPQELIEAYDWSKNYIYSDEIRTDPALVEWVKKILMVNWLLFIFPTMQQHIILKNMMDLKQSLQ